MVKMTRDEQKKNVEEQQLSPLAKDPTYGEKMYARIFNVGLNFWVNLLASGAFSFWVKHSNNSFKVFGKEFESLNKWQDRKIQWLEKTSIMKSLEPQLRRDRAEAIVNVFTLLIPGHFIMIPSVWLGAKFKAPIVKYFNRKHYGNEAMESPDLVARHHAIETAERPTLMGTTIARFSTAFINMGIARAIGSEDNLINKFAEKHNLPESVKKFGMDPTADRIGIKIGDAIHDMAPAATDKWNKHFENNGYNWSSQQRRDFAKGKFPHDVNKPYNMGVDNLTRYVVQDVMYTVFTASLISPVIKVLKKIVPGMTYTPKSATEETVAPIKVKSVRLADEAIQPAAEQPAQTSPTVRAELTDNAPQQHPEEKQTHHHATSQKAHSADEANVHTDSPQAEHKKHAHAAAEHHSLAHQSVPHAKVSQARTESTLTERHEHAVAHAG